MEDGFSKFVIEASDVQSMAEEFGESIMEVLRRLLVSAQRLARPPISKFHVAALGLSSDGRVFLGVNLEFPGLPLSQSVHAEQFLATNLSQNGSSTQLRCISVSAAPCGHCRQFLQEIRGAPDIQIHISGLYDDFKPLSHLLPHRFGPQDLLSKQVPLLLDPRHNGLVLLSNTKDDRLALAALEAANRSHSPYSGCPSGVSLLDCDGNVYAGSYMESAAYNPSIPPVQSAIVSYIIRGGTSYDRIVSATLVESQFSSVAHEHSTRLFLNVVSPLCQFCVSHCIPSNGSKIH